MNTYEIWRAASEWTRRTTENVELATVELERAKAWLAECSTLLSALVADETAAIQAEKAALIAWKGEDNAHSLL